MFCPFVCYSLLFFFLWWWLFINNYIVLKHKTCNCSPKHNNYLQNNKNFAHSLDIETYKYVAQHDSRASAIVSVSVSEWETHRISSEEGHSSLNHFDFDRDSCWSIGINDPHNFSILIQRIRSMRAIRSKVQTCVEIFEWNKNKIKFVVHSTQTKQEKEKFTRNMFQLLWIMWHKVQFEERVYQFAIFSFSSLKWCYCDILCV